jgi:hypothetical protein
MAKMDREFIAPSKQGQMTTRMEVLDLIDRALTEHLGAEKVSRRADGVLIVAGKAEAFAIQALTIEAPEEADPLTFGEDLVEFIRSRAGRSAPADWSWDPDDTKKGSRKDDASRS